MTGLDDAGREELRRLAGEAVATGPWFTFCSGSGNWWVSQDGTQASVLANCGKGEGADRDAAYVAAVSPDVVLGLLDEVDRLRSVIREAVEQYDRDAPDYHPAFIADLQLALEADRD